MEVFGQLCVTLPCQTSPHRLFVTTLRGTCHICHFCLHQRCRRSLMLFRHVANSQEKCFKCCLLAVVCIACRYVHSRRKWLKLCSWSVRRLNRAGFAMMLLESSSFFKNYTCFLVFKYDSFGLHLVTSLARYVDMIS